MDNLNPSNLNPEQKLGGQLLPLAGHGNASARHFFVGPAIVTICAFLAGVGYAIYLYKTDMGLDLLIITLPIIPFLFALPNLLLSLVVFALISRKSWFLPSLVLLCLVAIATPWIYTGIVQHNVAAGQEKFKRTWANEVQQGDITVCGHTTNVDDWIDCVGKKVRTQADVAVCLQQAPQYQPWVTSVETLLKTCTTIYQRNSE